MDVLASIKQLDASLRLIYVLYIIMTMQTAQFAEPRHTRVLRRCVPPQIQTPRMTEKPNAIVPPVIGIPSPGAGENTSLNEQGD